MSKRFTETEKWRDPWFRRLSPAAKLAWQWILDNCDAAGVIEPDWELAEFQVGHEIWEVIGDLGDRVELLGDGVYWVPKFIPFQYGELSEECRAHGPAFRSLAKHGLKERVSKGYPKGMDTHIYKDKNKDKDKNKEGESEGKPELPHGEAFAEAWADWLKYRKERKKKLTPSTSAKQLKKFAAMEEAGAVASINQSIENGWIGLFTKFNPPTLGEALSVRPDDQDTVKAWHAARAAVGWKRNGAPIESWKADLAAYRKNCENGARTFK